MSKRTWVIVIVLTLINVGLTVYNFSQVQWDSSAASNRQAPPTAAAPTYGPAAATTADEMPSLDLLAGIVRLQEAGGDHKLTSGQADAILPLASQVALDRSKTEYLVSQTAAMVEQQLRPDQKRAFDRALAGLQASPPGAAPAAQATPGTTSTSRHTMGVIVAPTPPYPGISSTPMPVVELAAWLRQRAGLTPSAPVPVPTVDVTVAPQTIHIDHYAQALLSLRSDPQLALTPQQAKALVPYFAGQLGTEEAVRDRVRQISAQLTQEQRDFIVQHHQNSVAGGVRDVEPTRTLQSLWAVLD